MDLKIRCVNMVTEEAIEIMGTGKIRHSFEMCCQNVCTWASLLEDGNWPRHWRTVARWHAEFCTHNIFLIHRHHSKRNPLPLLPLDNPEEAFAIRTFVRKNLDDITVEKMHLYIKDVIIPRIASNFLDQTNEINWVHEDEGEVRSIKIKELLKHYGLKTFCIVTAWSWMRSLGMRYCNRKKNFYVDGHERKDVVVMS